jgi:hypothetical protein
MGFLHNGAFFVLFVVIINSIAEKSDAGYELPYPALHLEIPYADYYTLLRILSVSNPLLSEFYQRNSPQGKYYGAFEMLALMHYLKLISQPIMTS